jgi:hypothetical protein
MTADAGKRNADVLKICRLLMTAFAGKKRMFAQQREARLLMLLRHIRNLP